MKKLLVFAVLSMSSWIVSAQEDLTQFVDPIIGTQEMGHTFPGACAPFGMVQLSPDTDTIPHNINGEYTGDVYRYCAGYQYLDKSIVGFSHTHLSGTGHSDLGDFLIMPTVGDLKLNPGTSENPDSGYRSRFTHDTETATPGYYKVELEDYEIKAELTATQRVGVHKYTFPKSDDAHILLDLTHGIYNYDGKVLWSTAHVINDTLVTGFRMTRGWSRTNYLYFAMTFSKPIKKYGCRNNEKVKYNGFWRKFDETKNFPQMEGKALTTHFDFDTEEGEQIQVKFAISAVSTEGALKNLRAEVPHFDFDKTRTATKAAWQKELSKIKVEADREKKVTFYTSLYHTMISPVEYMDVDGKYRGVDHNIHQADGFANYSVFSLWDTYRALHPLLNIIHPTRSADMVTSMLKHYEQNVQNMLPIWSHYGNENWCMIGYHAVPVISDAYATGIRNFDETLALEAMIASANHRSYDNIGDYIDFGYVPHDKNAVGASMTLEYAYDDWAIYQYAKRLGKTDIANRYYRRAQNWKILFDKESGYIRPKDSKGNFVSDFDPLDTHHQGFIEGNAWNYSLYVPQNPAGLIQAMGGKDKFTLHLDSLFTMHMPARYFENTEDITRDGIMGLYVHGNEPSHHVPYLYAWTNEPWKTAQRIHQIMNTKYLNKPDGLCGNDDCGQMSAWYVFSSLGFYPVAPGSGEYIIGSPSVHKGKIQLENGNTFRMEAKNLSKKNIYIQSVTLNGKKWDKTYISYFDIADGSLLKFVMGPRPNKKWGVSTEAKPLSMASVWDEFPYPTVDFENKTVGGNGDYYTELIPDPQKLIRDVSRDVCELLYNNSSEIDALDSITYTIEDRDVISAKDGAPPHISIFFSSQYLVKKQAEEISENKLIDEIEGVLFHEITHGYQFSPEGAGGYAKGTDFFGMIEGVADYIRYVSGHFDVSLRKPGGNWNSGYKTTGFFIDWLHVKDIDFVKKFNASAKTINPWSWEKSTQQILGESVQDLWDQYQHDLKSGKIFEIDRELLKKRIGRKN